MKKQKLTGMLLLIFLLILAGCPIPSGVQHTVSFDSKGGSDVTSQRVVDGGYADEPTAPIKSGYDFKGWYSDSELTTAWNFTSDKVDAAQTLYAKWEVQQQTTPYTVSFDSKGGSDVSSQRVVDGGYATEPTAPTRSGYDFKGWYSDSELTTAWNFTSNTVTAAQTLYAKWEVQQQTTPYTVSFDSKGGSPVSSQRVNHGGYATEPTAPTRSGYVFKGWYSDSGLSNAWHFATDTVDAAQTLYAKWEVQQQTTPYTVSFDSKGGNPVSSQRVVDGGYATEPTAPTRSGYIFQGWYSDSGLSKAWNFATDTVDAAQTLYAKWEVQQQTTPYTVSFDSKGGNPVSSQRVNPGGYAAEPTVPTRSGYIFQGWYSDSGLSKAWNFATDTVNQALRLYAKWEANKYTLSFNSNGGSAVFPQTVDYGQYATEPTVPTRSGYIFQGWYSDSGLSKAWNFATDTVNQALRLYAKWEANKYTLSFNSNGGSAVSPQTVDYGQYAAEPTVPTRSGYIFQGWYSDSGLSKAWNFATDTVDESLTLYAKWEVQHTVSFNSNGGSDVTSQRMNHGGYATEPTAPTRSGYGFKGWYSDSGLSKAWNFATDTVDESLTLYAKWELNQYTVTFDSKGGSPVPFQTVDYGQYAAEPTVPTRTGYIFQGWYSDSGLSKAWNFATDTVNQALTLYAKWEVNKYTLSFNSKGGSAVPFQTVDYGQYAAEPTVPTRTGYTLQGWYSDSGLSKAWNFATDTVNQDLVLYAKWGFLLSFNSTGGSPVPSQIVAESETATEPPAPTRTGYIFQGWYLGSGLSNAWNFATDTVNQDLTLYAKWEVNKYTLSFNSKGGSDVPFQTVDYGQYAAEPTVPTRTGYTLQGWYSDSGLSKAWNFATDTVNQDLTLYAKWGFLLSFNSTGDSPVPSQTVLPGEYATEPPAPTRSGYGFKGWYSDPELKYAWNFTLYAVNQAQTLYAKWIAEYSISFESNGGSAVSSQSVTEGGYVTEPPDPRKSGYVFLGWYSDSGLSKAWNFGTAVNKAETLYAKWIAEYSISFESNGGGAVSSQRVTEGGYVTEPEDPTKTGLAFGGWYADSELSTAWDFATDTVNQDLTLYAKWGFRLSFDSNGGSLVPDQTVAEGETATEPPAPTRSGYHFRGWYSDSGLSYAWNFALFGVNKALTLYAKWEVTYSVSFESNGGSAVPSQMVIDGGYATEPPAPTRDRYVFKGWYADSELSAAWDFATDKVTAAQTLYAKWEPESQKTYSIGDTGPAGGKVFYDKGNYSDGWRYLEVAPSDQTDGLYEWGGYGTSVETSWYIGIGQANTRAIVAELGRDTVYAARICDELKVGEYDDWFLPSKGELDELNKQKEALGGFPSNTYWSSSDSSRYDARYLDFSGGSWYYESKNLENGVLAVRIF